MEGWPLSLGHFAELAIYKPTFRLEFPSVWSPYTFESALSVRAPYDIITLLDLRAIRKDIITWTWREKEEKELIKG